MKQVKLCTAEKIPASKEGSYIFHLLGNIYLWAGYVDPSDRHALHGYYNWEKVTWRVYRSSYEEPGTCTFTP